MKTITITILLISILMLGVVSAGLINDIGNGVGKVIKDIGGIFKDHKIAPAIQLEDTQKTKLASQNIYNIKISSVKCDMYICKVDIYNADNGDYISPAVIKIYMQRYTKDDIASMIDDEVANVMQSYGQSNKIQTLGGQGRTYDLGISKQVSGGNKLK